MADLGPTGRAVCERVYPAMRSLIREAYFGADRYKVHLAPNLWKAILLEEGSGSTAMRYGTIFGLKFEVDNTLNDDQIRLRHEVVA